MLNSLFALGVPGALLLLYLLFFFLKRIKNSDYRRFVLTLISVFLTTFSYQVYRYSQSVVQLNSVSDFKKTFGYSATILLIPLIVGLILTILNFILLFRQLQKKD